MNRFGRRDLRFTLVSARAEDATEMVPGSTTDHFCEGCSKAVVVSPDSLAMLGWGLVSQVLCVPCAAELVKRTVKTKPVPKRWRKGTP